MNVTKDEPRPGAKAPNSWSERFLANMFWMWLSVGASFVSGFVLAPVTIRQLGSERYGLWALAFALIEYFMLVDLGLRTAVVNRVSRLRAQGELAAISPVINTALGFLGPASFLIASLLWISAPWLAGTFSIPPERAADFTHVLRIIATSVVLSLLSNVLNAGLEAFQQFKLQSRIAVLALVVRSTGCLILLWLGYGLRGMGAAVIASQAGALVALVFAFRRTFPEFTWSWGQAPLFWEMLAYGRHSMLAWMGSTFLTQAPPVLIGWTQPAAAVGYFTLPSRLLSYMVELVTRMGFVTMPNVAEMAARGHAGRIVQLGVYLNRYCLALFMPLAIFFLVYGQAFVRRWVGEEFAVATAELLPVFAIGTTLAVAGQFGSSQILFGMARHQNYAYSLLAEALVVVAALLVALPRYGLLGAALVTSCALVINRGLVAPFLLCRVLEQPYWSYLRSIYTTPVLTALPVGLGAWLLRGIAPGLTWLSLLMVLALISASYYAIYYFAGVERAHRMLFWNLVQRRLGWAAA